MGSVIYCTTGAIWLIGNKCITKYPRLILSGESWQLSAARAPKVDRRLMFWEIIAARSMWRDWMLWKIYSSRFTFMIYISGKIDYLWGLWNCLRLQIFFNFKINISSPPIRPPLARQQHDKHKVHTVLKNGKTWQALFHLSLIWKTSPTRFYRFKQSPTGSAAGVVLPTPMNIRQ